VSKPYAGIGPRWLALLLLAFAALEIPWVVYLAFFQIQSATVYHTHLAAAGVTLGALVGCAVAAGGLWRGAPWTPIATTVAGTMLLSGGVAGALAVDLPEFAGLNRSVTLLVITVPGAAVAFVASYRALAHKFGRGVDRVFAVALLTVAGLLLVRLVITFSSTGAELSASHLRLLVVLLDTAEVVALGGAGLALMKDRPAAAIFFGSAGVVLFLGDAWLNLVLVPAGPAFVAAILYAVVGEVPSTAMCAMTVAIGYRHWRQRVGLASQASLT
jgi:hypothetical protein